ncbi:MAG: hypothetical protein CL606_00790 [Anaerolineaceae bacterium]|nr:hypothetical protein [Anaerolineaceae bacterium]|tara:strand:- start:2161 stop:3291 length:1131 start_codon:yes stop_codon:yes gene_type:complete
MRIGIDAIHISRNLKGIGRVERSIVETLAEASYSHEFIVFLDKDPSELGLPKCDHIAYSVNKSNSLVEWEQIRLNRAARKHKIDCLLTLSDRVPLLYSGQIVLYLFETPDRRRELSLTHKTARFYQRASDNLTRILFPISIKRASLIAVPSIFTSTEIQNKYGVLDQKLMVVPAGVSRKFCPANASAHKERVRKRYGATGRYVLHFASDDPRDNTETALRAFALANIAKDIKIILIGSGYHDQDYFAEIVAKIGLNDRVISVGHVEDSDLVDLYQAADIYMDPSLYEGFGLQVLEAMSCGIPVLCSNTTSLPEIAGNVALTYKPNDIRGFADGIEYLMFNTSQMHLMRDAGILHASKYSWNKTVEQLVSLCEHAIG